MSRRLPLADAAALVGPARRTRALRLSAAAVLALVLAAALSEALERGTGEPRLAPPGRTSVLVLDVSSSVQPLVFRQVEAALGRAIREGGTWGLVVFSDTAYELFPPGTPAAELEGVRRYFVPITGGERGRTVAVGGVRFPANPWLERFTSGTKVSTGLEVARAMLRRERVRDGAVVLVSDLEDEYLDVPRLARVLTTYANEELPLKIEALSPTPDDLRLFRRLVQGPGEIGIAERPAAEAERAAALPSASFPLAVAILAVLLAAGLALNEHLCARLPLGPREGA